MKFSTTLSKTIAGLTAVVFLTAGGGIASGKPVVGKSLHDQLLGYWAPDKEAMLEMMQAEMKKAGQVDPQQLAQASAMVEMMASSFIAHFTKDTATMYGGPGEPEKSGYKVKSSDKATGTITVEVNGKDGKKNEEGKAILKGDKMIMVSGEQKMHMNRITEAEFKSRQAAMKKLGEGLKGQLDAASDKAEKEAKPEK